jgi:hypothetical protein
VNWSNFPWWILIPLAAIIVGGIVAVIGTRGAGRKSDKELTAALERTVESNRVLTERIDQLDRRLASVEKTLNDIP